jgi:DNA-binding PadR family transcriptional regulator
MKHCFDIELAKKVGINAAILLENIAFWVRENEANRRNYHDGKYWTYNTKHALHEQFPYMSEKQISTALQKLIDSGYIVKGHYCENARDRTLWYSLTDEGKAMIQYVSMDSSQEGECNRPKGKMEETKREECTITDINKTDINTDKKRKKEESYDGIVSEYTSNPDLRTALCEFIKMRKLIKKPMTNFALKNLLAKLDRLASADSDKIAMLYNAIEHCWQSVYPLKPDAQQPTGYANGVQMPAPKVRRTEEEILADDDGIL